METTQKKKKTTINMKLDSTLKKELEDAASQRGLSVAGFLRMSAIEQMGNPVFASRNKVNQD